MGISRRSFTKIAAASVAAEATLGSASHLTAQDVVGRIQSALGGDWPATSVDGFKAGSPGTRVSGIATTAMATADVLRQALKQRCNFVITYEPTFFGREDGVQARGLSAGDPVFQAKKEFIAKNDMAVFRLHDHWLSCESGEMTNGLAEALGWTRYRWKPEDVLYDIPAARADEVVVRIRSRLNLRGGLRAVGDRKATIRRVLLQPGFLPAATLWQRYRDADLIVTGEVREWENTHFAADLFTAGEKKGLVTIGRVASEDPGMRVCAMWLKNLIKEVPVQWISSGDLFWRAS